MNLPRNNRPNSHLTRLLVLALILCHGLAQEAPIVPDPAPPASDPPSLHTPFAVQKIAHEIFDVPRGNLIELRDAIQQILSPEGKVILLPAARKVFVQDRPSVMETVRQLIAAATAPQPQVRVEVAFAESQQSASSNGSISSGHVESRGGTIRVQPLIKDSLSVDFGAQTGHSQRHQSAFLMVQSGGAASMIVARELPRATTYFRSWAHSFGLQETVFTWERIGTSLRIEPTVFGDQIQLTLLPQFTNLENQTLIVRELATHLTLSNGASLQIGGFDKASNDFNAYFFGFDRARQSSGGAFTLRASIVSP